jgi:hypothetical protein
VVFQYKLFLVRVSETSTGRNEAAWDRHIHLPKMSCF